MRDRKNSQAYRERIQGTAKQQQSKLVRSEKKLTHARDGGFPTPTSAGKKTRKDEAWVTAERRRLDMPALTEEEKAKRGWRPAAARLSLPFSPPAPAAAAAAAAADDSEEDTLGCESQCMQAEIRIWMISRLTERAARVQRASYYS